jgi:hypothetical protein
MNPNNSQLASVSPVAVRRGFKTPWWQCISAASFTPGSALFLQPVHANTDVLDDAFKNVSFAN